MDAFGKLELRWSQGYASTKLHYIKKDVICYVCGNSIKFINTTTKDESFLSSEGSGIACFAVNPTNMAVGFADKSMEPNIYIYTYPNLTTHRAKLKGGAKLEYSCIAFANNSNIVASYSGIPDFKLTIWNWLEGQMLGSVETEEISCHEMSFSPNSWKYLLTISTEDSVCLWNIEQSNQRYHVSPNILKLPYTDGSGEIGHYDDPSKNLCRMSNPLSSTSVKMTKAAIAGIDIKRLKSYIPGNEKERCCAVSHCWASDNIVYLGCKKGFLLSLDWEASKLTILMDCNLHEIQSSKDNLNVIQEEESIDPEAWQSILKWKNGLLAGGSVRTSS